MAFRPWGRRSVRGGDALARSALLASLGLVLALTACASGGGARPDTAEPAKRVAAPRALPELTILYFNDLHGHLVPFAREGDTTKVGGAARMATLIKKVREENDANARPTLVLEGGDIFQGTPLSSVFKGEPDFKFLNMIRLDAMVLGNHEFDFGLDVLRQRIGQAEFPVLAANVRWKEGGRLLTTPYVIKQLSNGVKVSLIGFVTDETPETTDPLNVRDLAFQPPPLAAARYIEALEDSSDIIVALTHIGTRADKLLADTYDDIDVIVGGHDQVLIQRPLEMEDVIITQAQEHGLYLGRLDLAVEGDDVKLLADTIYPITGAIPDDPEVAAMVASYTRRLDRELNATIGRLSTPLNGERHEIRKSLTNFGALVTSVMKERTGADIAVINSGAIRSSIDAGPVTLGEIVQALPFVNEIMTVQLTGESVQRMVEQSLAAQKRSDSGGFLQVAGLGYGGGQSGSAATVGGKPIEPSKLYTVALTDFLFNGGDGYELFRGEGRNPRHMGSFVANVLADHIRKNSPLSVLRP